MVSISIVSFATVIGTPEGITSAGLSIEFSFSTGIIKKLQRMPKATRNKNEKHDKVVILATSKLNSIEIKISEALIINEIGHEEFMLYTNKERNYRELKESVRMIKSQRSVTRKII